jgi:hypothetical protein
VLLLNFYMHSQKIETDMERGWVTAHIPESVGRLPVKPRFLLD